MLGVIEGIEKPVNRVSKDSLPTYNPTVTPIRSKDEIAEMRRKFYAQTSPSPPASATMDPANYPHVQTPTARHCATPTCICRFSPNAPQVENYVPCTFSPPVCAGTTLPQVEHADFAMNVEEHVMIQSIHKRITDRMGALVIPSSLELSGSEEEYCQVLQAMAATKRPRASKLSAARTIIITTPEGHGDPRTTLEKVDPRFARRQAREAKLQSSNIDSSTSSASMSPNTMRTAR